MGETRPNEPNECTTGWGRLWLRAIRPAVYCLGALYGATVLIGLFAFVGRDPLVASETRSPSPELDTGARADLARLEHGARAIVSSNDWANGHHPVYLIDGRAPTRAFERWAPVRDDRSPSLTLRWPRAVLPDSIRFELSPETLRPLQIEVSCRDQRHTWVVRDRPVVFFPLECPLVEALHIDLVPLEREPDTRNVVSIGELHVVGVHLPRPPSAP